MEPWITLEQARGKGSQRSNTWLWKCVNWENPFLHSVNGNWVSQKRSQIMVLVGLPTKCLGPIVANAWGGENLSQLLAVGCRNFLPWLHSNHKCYSGDISIDFFHYANVLPFEAFFSYSALPQILLKRIEAYYEIINVKRLFRIIFEVQICSVRLIARESQTVVLVYLSCCGSDKEME